MTISQLTQSRRSPLQFLYLLAAFGLAGVLLYYSLRGLDWRRVGQTLSTARPPQVALLIGIASTSLFLRAIRWRMLLQARAPVPVSTAFWATAGGYAGNIFLPARAGELVRTVMISSRTGLSTAYVLTTAIAERMADAVALVLISSVVLLNLPSPPAWIAGSVRLFALVGLTGALAIVLAPRLERFWRFLLTKLPIPDRFLGHLSRILDQILLGFGSFHSLSRLSRFVGLTGLIWFSDAVGAVTGARSLGLAVSLPTAFLLNSALGLASALPSTPGYVGIYQFVAVTVLTPYGFSRADAIAYILFLQATNYVVMGFFGLLAFIQRRKRSAPETNSSDMEVHAA